MMDLFGSYTGADFLLFYACLLALAVLAGLWIPRWLRAEGRFSAALDAQEIALLAGGKKRLVQTAVAELYAAGALTHGGAGKMAVALHDVPASHAGRAILRGGGIFDLREALDRVANHADDLEARLVDRDLLLNGHARQLFRIVAVLSYAALLVLGAYRWQAGEALGEPTEFLIGMMVLTLGLAIVRIATISPVTRAGEHAVETKRKQSVRLRSAPTADEAGMAVALFGTAVLVGTPFEAVHALRSIYFNRAAGDNGNGCGTSGSSDSGCGGGGGGGGGGCGGCGG